MFDKLINIIKKTKKIPNNIKRENKLTSDLIARYSNGNVSLQRDNFITATKLSQKEKIIFSHKFI
jgi:hypothetical protein